MNETEVIEWSACYKTWRRFEEAEFAMLIKNDSLSANGDLAIVIPDLSAASHHLEGHIFQQWPIQYPIFRSEFNYSSSG